MTDLQLALDHLAGYRVGPGRYAYRARDEGRLVEYELSADDWRELGALLRRGEPDAYSLWCANTLPLLRREL